MSHLLLFCRGDGVCSGRKPQQRPGVQPTVGAAPRVCTGPGGPAPWAAGSEVRAWGPDSRAAEAREAWVITKRLLRFRADFQAGCHRAVCLCRTVTVVIWTRPWH